MSAPTGCTLLNNDATCSFSTWSPPLLDSDFARSPGYVLVDNVNGLIPSNTFSGLQNSGAYSGTPQLNLDCGWGNSYEMTLLSDSLSSNLNWVQEMLITDCYNMDIDSGAFSYLTGLTLLTVIAGSFATISSTAFTGMTSLTTLYLYATFPSTGIPAGLFSGLTALTAIDMSRTTLNSIPSGLFDDLKSLTSLNMADCGLTTLPADAFKPLLSLTTLDISTNTWVCNCDLVWLANFETYTGLSGSGTCGSPSTLSGYSLKRSLMTLSCSSQEASNSNYDNWYRYGLIAGTSLAIILAVIGLVVSCYLRNKVKNAETLFKAKTKNQTQDKEKITQGESKNTKATTIKDTPVWTITNETLNSNQKVSTPIRTRKVQPSDVRITRVRATSPTLSSTEDW